MLFSDKNTTHQSKEASVKTKTPFKTFCKITIPVLLLSITIFAVMKIPDVSRQPAQQRLSENSSPHEIKIIKPKFKKNNPHLSSSNLASAISPASRISPQPGI
jgi:hypothetical protein